ncbi:unnamed protein product [Polarella glacialis]|uniref:DNAJ-containing protein X-domain domain-containing protein n=1 Tax=Polarella glacialis TaxID=89957 RepID=A0A813FPI8_POLGL|nr:unnamed protein product [Polarella glacialis]
MRTKTISGNMWGGAVTLARPAQTFEWIPLPSPFHGWVMTLAEPGPGLELRAVPSVVRLAELVAGRASFGEEAVGRQQASLEVSKPESGRPSSDEPIAKEAEADIASKQEEGQTGVSSSAGLSENSSSESCSEARPAGHAAPGHGGTFNNPPVEMREEQPLAPGTVVVLCGLRSNPELNDEVGIIECHDPEVDRYVIHLLSDLGARKLKRDNLIVIEDPSGPPNSSGSGGASSSSVPSPTPAEGSQEGQGEPGDKGWAPGGEEAEMADAFKDTMPLFHDTLWNVTALDIEFTLAKVIRKVLRDMSVDKTIRQGRAEAMLRLGKIFQEPLIERKKQGSKADGMLKDGSTLTQRRHQEAQSSESSAVGEKDKSRSVLARFKPSVRWRSSKPDELKAKEAKVQGEKQKQMEAAMALMAAGASTEDVDEMMAARAAMEAEFGSDFRL